MIQCKFHLINRTVFLTYEILKQKKCSPLGALPNTVIVTCAQAPCILKKCDSDNRNNNQSYVTHIHKASSVP